MFAADKDDCYATIFTALVRQRGNGSRSTPIVSA